MSAKSARLDFFVSLAASLGVISWEVVAFTRGNPIYTLFGLVGLIGVPALFIRVPKMWTEWRVEVQKEQSLELGR